MGFLIIIILLIIYSRSKVDCLLTTIVLYPTFYLFNIYGNVSIAFVVAMLLFFDLLFKGRINYSIGKKYWFFWPSVISLISYIGSFYFTSEKHITYLFQIISDVILVYMVWYYRKSITLRRISKYIIVYSAIIGAYGVFESFTGNNPIMSFLRDHGMIISTEQRDDYVRFGMYRAQSITIWCSIYGITCALSLIFLLNTYFRKKIRGSVIFYALCVLLFAGTLLSGTRTCMVFLAVGLMSLLTYFVKSMKKMIPLIVVALIGVYFAADYLQSIIDAFVNPDEVSGSSTEMRDMQMEAALSFLDSGYYWGNGIGYMSKALESTPELLGGESIMFLTIIERGVIGVISLLVYAILVVIEIIKKKCYFSLFIVLAYFFAKYNSLIPSLTEFYILFYVIPIMNHDIKLRKMVHTLKLTKTQQ